MGPTKLVKDSFSRLDTTDHVPHATEEVFLTPTNFSIVGPC